MQRGYKEGLCEISVLCGMSWKPPRTQACHEGFDKTCRGRRSTNKAICFSRKAKETMLSPRKPTAGHFVIGAITKSRSEGWALYEGKEGRSKILKREKLATCGAVQGYWLVSVTDPPSLRFLSLHVLHTPTHWVVLVVPSC